MKGRRRLKQSCVLDRVEGMGSFEVFFTQSQVWALRVRVWAGKLKAASIYSGVVCLTS